MVMVLLTPAFVQVGIVAYYHINKKYIEQQLCENRNKPAKNCQGHCYLNKQLKKAEQNEEKQSTKLVKEKEELITQNFSNLSIGFYPDYEAFDFPSFSFSFHFTDFRYELVKPPAAC